MLLAIDIGNTNTVFAVFDGDDMKRSWRLQTQEGRSSDEFAAFLHAHFVQADFVISDIKRVIISSVVPESDFAIRQFCEEFFSAAPVFVHKDMAGIAVDLERPEEVGADRLVNAVAVKACHQVPAIVIDFGTATTFDVITDDGVYAGGVIAPGIRLSISALHQAASKLPKVAVEKPERVIGKRTSAAMQSGVYWGYKGLIGEIVREITKEMGGEKPYVIGTGGLASLFAEDSDVIDCVDPALTLKGLQIIDKTIKA